MIDYSFMIIKKKIVIVVVQLSNEYDEFFTYK